MIPNITGKIQGVQVKVEIEEKSELQLNLHVLTFYPYKEKNITTGLYLLQSKLGWVLPDITKHMTSPKKDYSV